MKRFKPQMSLKNILLLMILISILVFYSVNFYKEKLSLDWFFAETSILTKEVKNLLLLIDKIADVPPDGVDVETWKFAVHEIGEEPFSHPLMGQDQPVVTPEELSKSNKSLIETRKYLERLVKNLPIQLEFLPSMRERVLRDLDTKKRLK